MAYRVLFSPKSVEDIDSVVEFYYIQSERAAEIVYHSIISRAETLEDYPERGRMVPEFLDEGIRQYRELIEGNFRIIYKIVDKSVVVLRIIDSRQLNDMKME